MTFHRSWNRLIPHGIFAVAPDRFRAGTQIAWHSPLRWVRGAIGGLTPRRRHRSCDGAHSTPGGQVGGGTDGGIPRSLRRGIIRLLPVGGLTGNALTEATSSRPSATVAVVAIQVRLRTLGYDPVPIDGHGGRRTIAALTAYANDRGIVLHQATVGTVVAPLRAEAYVMLLDSETTEEAGAWGRRGICR